MEETIYFKYINKEDNLLGRWKFYKGTVPLVGDYVDITDNTDGSVTTYKVVRRVISEGYITLLVVGIDGYI